MGYVRQATNIHGLCQNYLKKMGDQYKLLFGVKPKHYASPLEENDHPELDESDFLDEDETRIYQSLIGCTQWVIQLGRFDIAVHVMTLSSFRAKSCRCHLDRIKRVHQACDWLFIKDGSWSCLHSYRYA